MLTVAEALKQTNGKRITRRTLRAMLEGYDVRLGDADPVWLALHGARRSGNTYSPGISLTFGNGIVKNFQTPKDAAMYLERLNKS